jgi:crossover junction endodeoxyribonuclease RusA
MFDRGFGLRREGGRCRDAAIVRAGYHLGLVDTGGHVGNFRSSRAGRMIAIELPWPPSVLLPNSRTHWSKRAHAAKQCRLTAYALTRQAGIRKGDFDIPGRVKVTLAFAPPDRRRRDLDGMLSSAKNFLDGISDAIGIDDSRFEIAIRREEPVKGGVVRAELEAAPEDRIAHEAKKLQELAAHWTHRERCRERRKDEQGHGT